MRVVDPGSQPLSNAEVLAHIEALEKRDKDEKRTNKIPKDLETVMREVHTYFGRPSQPMSRHSDRVTFTPDAVHKLTTALRAAPYELLQSEILQILNHVPKDAAEISMLVEDADQRFTEEQLEAMFEVIKGEMVKVQENGVGEK